MNEQLLQFVWKHRYFNHGPYHTMDGRFLEIIDTGVHNFNQGPDFLHARIKIDHTEWAGNIELHVLSSDWLKHGHEKDQNYSNIILHVVWDEDKLIYDQHNKLIPTFCLQPYISNLLLNKYSCLMQASPFIKPCASFLPAMNNLNWLSWKERLVVERLEKKSARIFKYLTEIHQDWETLCWWLLASNMGLKVNEPVFEMMARSIPLKIIGKHRNQIIQLEALLLGQSNLLCQEFEEPYPIMLQKEYRFLQKKYKLEKLNALPAFLRMRPASFPTLRLAQLAKLLQENDHLFNLFKTEDSIYNIQKKLMILPNDYWLYHYRFDELGAFKEKRLGQPMVNSILINTVIPILFAWGLKMKEPQYQEKALNWLLEMQVEKNKIIKEWETYQIHSKNAFDSQAMIELQNSYCLQKKCLRCSVGICILENPI